jgi:phosphate-selective porin OprO/OprP
MESPHTGRPAVAFILLTIVLLAEARMSSAQDTLPTPPSPSPAPPPPATTGSDVPPPADTTPPAAPMTQAQMEERIRQLEAMVSRLAAQQPGGGLAPDGAGPLNAGGTVGRDDPNVPVPGTTNPNATYPRSSGPLAPGQGTPMVPPPNDQYNMPANAYNFPLKARFGPGFEFRTEDDEYVLQFHNLTQVDFRGYEQGGQNPVHDSFLIPRQWFMFSGRLQKPYEYFVSIQNVLDTVNMLDVFGNVHYDDRIQFKIGRYKTPFTYEFYALPIQGLVNSERSLFFNNFALNRAIGADVWGQLFDKKVDYAAGIYNGARNSYVDVNDSKNFLGFVNWRPFLEHEDSFLQFLNVGGSVMTGNVNNVPLPFTMRTDVATTGNAAAGVPFFTFNSNAREEGLRTYWDLHAALYRKQLSLIAEWQSGSTQYALTNTINERTKVPVESYYVQAGYFITGETVSGRNVVNPIKNFDLRPGQMGPGAIELTARYNYLAMGPKIYTAGLADPNVNTRSLYTTDIGANWYWTQNIKWYFTWEHAVFGTPVVFAPGRLQSTSDVFWARFQIFF